MKEIPFIPRLNDFSCGMANDVLSNSQTHLPINQRIATHLPYTANVSFLLNGIEHDKLMKFYVDNQSKYFLCKMTLLDSKLKPYQCLFASAPIIIPKMGNHDAWTTKQINTGKADTKNCYYESHWQMFVYVPDTFEQDVKIVDDYQYITNDPFVDFTFGDRNA